MDFSQRNIHQIDLYFSFVYVMPQLLSFKRKKRKLYYLKNKKVSNSGESTSFALQTSSHCPDPQVIPISQGPWEITSAPSEVTQTSKGLPPAQKQGWYGAEQGASENPAFYLWAREEEQMRRSSFMRCQLAFSRRKPIAGDTTSMMPIRNVMLRVLPSVRDFWTCTSADGSLQQWQHLGEQQGLKSPLEQETHTHHFFITPQTTQLQKSIRVLVF